MKFADALKRTPREMFRATLRSGIPLLPFEWKMKITSRGMFQAALRVVLPLVAFEWLWAAAGLPSGAGSVAASLVRGLGLCATVGLFEHLLTICGFSRPGADVAGGDKSGNA